MAVLACYPDRHSPVQDVKGQCNRHDHHPLSGGVANRLPLCSARCSHDSGTNDRITHISANVNSKQGTTTMEAVGFCHRCICLPDMRWNSWLPFGYPSYKKVFLVAKTIQHTKCGKVVEYQQVSEFCNTSENGKTTTRNEKVACSSQVTSSIGNHHFTVNSGGFSYFLNDFSRLVFAEFC